MYHRPDESKFAFRMVASFQIKFPTLAVYTVSLPLVSFMFCVIWSVLFNFELSTFTHCRVTNYLPSISAAIGSFTPQRYVWQASVAVHSAPRFLVVAMYYIHLSDILYNDPVWQWTASVIFIVQLTEVSSLLGLTFVTSADNFSIHKHFFIAFMVSALSNMALLYFAMKQGSKHKLTALDRLSLKSKGRFATTNFISFCLALYFYYRHNWYCEPMMYTYFAFFEYIVVVTNMAYHMTAYWDFSDHVITVKSCCSVSVSSKPVTKFWFNDFVIKVA